MSLLPSKGLAAPPKAFPLSRPSSGFTGSGGVSSPFHSAFSMEDGPMFDPCKIPGSRSLHERKLATWALLIGETRSSAAHAEVRRRPHRGMLPDVDFSQAVPDLSRPSLVRRLIRLIRRPDGDKGRAVAENPVGETAPVAYIGRDKASAPGDSSGARAFAATHTARAA
jgi:hypothetical protein